MTSRFRAGFDRLTGLGGRSVTAIMCAEAVLRRCHRRIIADYLLASEHLVFHILGPGKIGPAALTPRARPSTGRITYPASE
ncbi:DUF488 domain-containing protein [Microvirga sp. BT689]|nr:DUF488 domain-containing protein [Microvirga arvi]